MKITTTIMGMLTALILAGCGKMPEARTVKETYSSFDLPSEHPVKDAANRLSYEAQGLPLPAVLKMYEQISGRTVITGRLAEVTISFRSATPLTRIEALQMLDTVLAEQDIAMVLSGDKMVKAVPAAAARTESPPEITLPWRSLPESSSIMSRTVHLQHLKPSEIMPALVPMARLPNGMVGIDSQRTLLLLDFSSNIRQQLKLLEEWDQEPPRTKSMPSSPEPMTTELDGPANAVPPHR
jgi:type II secretory pathway component GspD/PulD (secretin)